MEYYTSSFLHLAHPASFLHHYSLLLFLTVVPSSSSCIVQWQTKVMSLFCLPDNYVQFLQITTLLLQSQLQPLIVLLVNYREISVIFWTWLMSLIVHSFPCFILSVLGKFCQTSVGVEFRFWQEMISKVKDSFLRMELSYTVRGERGRTGGL